MQWEILNIIKYFIILLLSTTLVLYVKHKVCDFKISYWILVVLFVTLITHKQFYTLTEKEDTRYTQLIMKRQINSNNTIDKYLELKENRDSEVKEISIEELLENQKEKSLKLIKEIENKHKGDK